MFGLLLSIETRKILEVTQMLFSNLLNRLLQQLPKNKAVKLGIETFSGVKCDVQWGCLYYNVQVFSFCLVAVVLQQKLM